MEIEWNGKIPEPEINQNAIQKILKMNHVQSICILIVCFVQFSILETQILWVR
jgi:hypothetical protein